MPAPLIDRLEAARKRAVGGGIPARRKDADLYALLAECKAICEDVARYGEEEALRSLYWDRAHKSERRQRYIEAGADVHIIVCRYVLDGDDTRNSTYRYALTLREAAKRQIAAAGLPEWLAKNGGVNALYKARVTESRIRTAKTLHLTSAIAIPPGQFSVTLSRLPNGFFEVIV